MSWFLWPLYPVGRRVLVIVIFIFLLQRYAFFLILPKHFLSLCLFVNALCLYVSAFRRYVSLVFLLMFVNLPSFAVPPRCGRWPQFPKTARVYGRGRLNLSKIMLNDFIICHSDKC